MMGRIQGVLLDVDGTLALSNDDQARSWVAAFAERAVRPGAAADRHGR